jgi:predicted ArsR family transcriptional regulator
MSVQLPTSDAELLDLLRIAGPLSILELAHAMEVTATAVRQRLPRLLGQKAIQREVISYGRGRPRHRYRLTEMGLQRTDSNFLDLALTLWEEIRQSSDQELRREALRRIARALASVYADQSQDKMPAEQRDSLAKLLNQRADP